MITLATSLRRTCGSRCVQQASAAPRHPIPAHDRWFYAGTDRCSSARVNTFARLTSPLSCRSHPLVRPTTKHLAFGVSRCHESRRRSATNPGGDRNRRGCASLFRQYRSRPAWGRSPSIASSRSSIGIHTPPMLRGGSVVDSAQLAAQAPAKLVRQYNSPYSFAPG